MEPTTNTRREQAESGWDFQRIRQVGQQHLLCVASKESLQWQPIFTFSARVRGCGLAAIDPKPAQQGLAHLACAEDKHRRDSWP
ncbi:hypothetical protein DIPPA_20910 [Diplonema papillatum]|nr:hypothetical protein DIPPA_20910 [Diplonema papillatum]KAJ9444134.1 hypothetical protein DIPPA_20910 [Diplonema papillatum]